MSIINDALKKAQEKLEQKGKKADIKEVTKVEPSDKAVAPKPKPKKSSVSMRRKRVWYKTVHFLVPLFFCITLLFVGSIIFLMNRSRNTTEDIQRNYRPKKKSNRPLKKGELQLNGISTIENRRVALINNEIYENGDTIGQYTIESVESTIVLLKDAEGEIVTLKVR